MKTTYLLVILSALFASVLSLSCWCDKKKCVKAVCPNGGIVKDICLCCDVCAKQVGQKCGGLFNLAGRCDKGLECVVRKHGIIINHGTMKPGRCELAACKSLSCPKYYSCSVVNNQAVCECPRHCKNSGQNVCGDNGREYANECELRRYECKKNVTIGFKHGPCKRCVMNGQRYKFGEQVRIGQCELCSCAHGIWNCKNAFCLNQDTKNHAVPSFPAIKKPKYNRKCPVEKCKRCKYGYIVDDNGCKTCDCKPKKNICGLSKNSGRPCGSFQKEVRRFFFNYKRGKCEEFIFFGCDHNSNNFKTKKACEARCLV